LSSTGGTRNRFQSARLAGAGPLRTRIGGHILNITLPVRASRTAAALGTVLAAAALALGAAGPAQALTCGPGSVVAVAGNGAEFCSPTGTGGVTGGGGVSTGNGGSTVPGQAAPIAGGSGGGAPVFVPAPAPYVPPVQAPAPVYAPAPAPAYNPGPAPVQNPGPNSYTPAQGQPVKGVAPAENPVIDGVPAEAPVAEATPTETPAAVAPSETPSVRPSATQSPSATPSAQPIQGTKASSTMSPGPFLAGVLAVLVVSVAAWYWGRSRKSAAER
jgi:hypothetical protein